MYKKCMVGAGEDTKCEGWKHSSPKDGIKKVPRFSRFGKIRVL